MIITIDAQKVAHQLAVTDTAKFFCKGTSGRVSEEEVKDAIENDTSLTYKISPVCNIDSDIRGMYQRQHDYYFEILTNSLP